MPTPEVTALADQLRAHLENGDLASLGAVELAPDGTRGDAETLARIVLADVAHRQQVADQLGRSPVGAGWDDLAVQLRCLQRAVHRRMVGREARLRDLAEQAPAILWSTDADLRLTAVAGGGMARYAHWPASSLGRPLAELIGTADPASPALDAHRRALGGESSVYEQAWYGAVYRAEVGPLRGAGGDIVGAVGVALEVTESRPAGPAPRPAEEPFRVALRGSPIIVYSQDAELRHTWIYNPLHGFSPEGVIGKTDAEVVRPAILTAIKRRVLATGVGARQDVRVTVGDDIAYYDLTVEPLRGPTGEIVGVTGAAANITPLKRTEEALARREAQLAEAERLVHLGSWEWHPADGSLHWSDEHYRIFGLEPRAPVTLESAQDRIHPEDIERARAIFEASLRGDGPYECELRIVRPDGDVRVIHSRGALLPGAPGQPARMVGTAQDVTERRRAEEERAVQRERQARLAGMLFAARALAARMNDELASSAAATDAAPASRVLVPDLRRSVETVLSTLSTAIDDVAELQRLIPTTGPEHGRHPAPGAG
jgi:PAS domain S-box-containing protein